MGKQQKHDVLAMLRASKPKKGYYNNTKAERQELSVNESVEGESIELMMERLINNNEEEIIEGKELIFTKPEHGIIGEFNIRHDHWDDAAEKSSLMAVKATELDEAQLKKRKELLKKQAEEEKFLKEDAAKKLAERNAGDNPAE